MISRKVMLEIKKYAIDQDWNRAFSGKSKGNRHLFRMVKISKRLAKILHANTNVVEAAAWLHDIPLALSHDYDYVKNKQLAHKLIEQFKISKPIKSQIVECIAAHEGIISHKTLESKIIHDADVIEKSGILGLIRHSFKVKHLGFDEEVSSIIKHILWRASQIQTQPAKKIAREFNRVLKDKTIFRIVPKIHAGLNRGLTSDEIAKSILAHLELKQKILLKSQLRGNVLNLLDN